MTTKTGTFEIRDKFYLNGEPFQIISGGIHYFRILPEYWEDRLQKLKELGCNTVETYIPWNMHEPVKGKFDFYGEHVHGMLDVVSFVRTAQRLGLWVIPVSYTHLDVYKRQEAVYHTAGTEGDDAVPRR